VHLHFVVKDGVVEGKTETDRVSGGELLSNLGCLLVSSVGVFSSILSDFTGGVLSHVSVTDKKGKYGEEKKKKKKLRDFLPVVVSLHLEVEDLSFIGGLGFQEVVLQNSQNILANVAKFSLDLCFVGSDSLQVGLVALALLLLFNGRDDSPGSTARTNNVFVGNRQKVPLLKGQLCVGGGDLLHRINHVLIALSLLGEFGKVNIFFSSEVSHLCLCLLRFVFVRLKRKKKKKKATRCWKLLGHKALPNRVTHTLFFENRW